MMGNLVTFVAALSLSQSETFGKADVSVHDSTYEWLGYLLGPFHS